MADESGLLNRQGSNSFGGSNPSASATNIAGVTQLVECNLAKVDVASSSLVARTMSLACVAQLVVHLICNQRVGGSSPSTGTIYKFVYYGSDMRL